MRAVLVGFGSVGRKHAKCLVHRFSPLVIVDENAAARYAAKEQFPEAIVLKSISELWRFKWDWNKVLVVIATWGPSHYSFFNECAKNGVRHVVCEKPLSNSLSTAKRMITEARSRGVILGVNHTRRFQGIDSGLRALAERFSLGTPQSVVIHGGAAGLVTNGIHFVDLAISLFQMLPTSVMSTAVGETINPRSPRLMFYRGTAVWTFDSGREATLTFNNMSSVFPTFSIYYRNAVVHLLHDDHVVVLIRDMRMVLKYPEVTRTGRATEELYSGPVPGALDSYEPAFLRLYDEVESGWLRTFPPEYAYEALQACIGALISGGSGKRIQLPLDPESDLGRMHFSIS